MSKDYCVVIPKGYQPSGEYADELARLADRLLLLTSLTAERRSRKHWIPFSADAGVDLLSSRWYAVSKEARRSGLMDMNDCYSVGRFSKSVRLSDRYRTGEYELYALSRKPRNSGNRKCRLPDPTGEWLYERMHDFQLPEVTSSDPWEMHAAARIRRGDLFATYCEYGRFHSNYTSLSKGLRRQLHTPANEQLWQLDVANCQPLILGAMAKQQSDSPDVRRWLDDCQSGRIYESILEVFQEGSVQPYYFFQGRRMPARPPRSRDAIKKPFLIALFSRVDDMRKNSVYAAIEHRYPTIARYLVEAKASGHQALAHQCQRAESRIVIKTVCRKLLPTSRPLLTIHDALIMTTDLLERADAELKRAFRERLGVEPIVKRERCDSLSLGA